MTDINDCKMFHLNCVSAIFLPLGPIVYVKVNESKEINI